MTTIQRIRCPDCGTISFVGHLTYPICHQCHHHFEQCGNCRHFPGDGLVCRRLTRPAAVHVRSRRSCPTFRTSLTESPQPTNAPLNAAMMASLVVCTVLGLVTSIASLTTVPQPLSHSLSVTAEWPAAAAVGSLARASFIIENRSSHSHEQVRLRLPERLFQHFECLAVQPQPQAEESLGSYRYLYLGTLPPQQRIELSMTLRAQTRGAFSCQARVFTRDNVCFPSGARQLAVLHRAGDSS